MGRCAGWTATTEGRLNSDLALGLGTAAIAKKRGWNMVSVRRAIRKARSGASVLTKGKCSKITETVSNYIKEMSEKDKSLAEVRRGTATDFGVTLSRSTISGHLRMKLKKTLGGSLLTSLSSLILPSAGAVQLVLAPVLLRRSGPLAGLTRLTGLLLCPRLFRMLGIFIGRSWRLCHRSSS